MTIQLKTGAFLRWIRAIWLTALLAAFGLFGVVSASAFSSAPLSFGYDGQNQPSVAYDDTFLPAFNYDRASFQPTNESENGIVETGGTFATFSKFLAAEGGLNSTLRGTPMDSGLLNRIKTAFEGKSPGHIFGNNAWGETHLGPDLRITGETLNERVIALRINPSTSSVYEELIHTAQLRRGMTDVTQMEIEAAQKLIRFADQYHIPASETAATIQRLRALQGLK